MPTKTFFNLSDEKREKITSISIDEFAMHDYRSASLSRIVQKAGIAKGSMYQYFKNKKDLYYYIIDYVSKYKLDYISKSIDPSLKDFFSIYKNIIFLSSKFDWGKPRYSRVLYNGMKENNKEVGDIALKLKRTSNEYLTEFIKFAQTNGDIRRDIDTDLIVFMINELSISVVNFIADKYNLDIENIIFQKNVKVPVSEEILNNIVDDMIEFFKYGIGKRN